ncbi:MAG: SET domain-containing protein-lysine N-methyltransferase [Ferruginibacter sp.]
MLKPYLFVDDAGAKGRGVFTSKRIGAGKVVEISPVIVMSGEDRQHLDKTPLHNYIFEWGENKDKCCMSLGLVAVYNHSYESNCEYFMDYEADTILVKSVRRIEKGEELTINYNGDWNNENKLWFEAK